MTIGGWIILICMWGGILGTTIFCFARVLGGKDSAAADE